MFNDDALYRKLWKTKGCRFKAHSRLLISYWVSVIVISMLSIFVIAVSIISLTFAQHLTELGAATLNTANITISLMILVLSLIEGARGTLARANAFHECALDINEIYKRYQIKLNQGSVSESDRQGFAENYDSIIRRCKDNHSSIDYLMLQIENPKDFDLSGVNYSMRFVITYIRYFLNVFWWYTFILLTIPFVMSVIFYLYWGVLVR